MTIPNLRWKTAHRSFCDHSAPEPADPDLRPGKVARHIIDVRNTCLHVSSDPTQAAFWAPFDARMRQT